MLDVKGLVLNATRDAGIVNVESELMRRMNLEFLKWLTG